MSQAVYRNIGQSLFKVFIHEIFVFVFGIVCRAGPAAKIDLCSGSFDIQFSAAVQAFSFYVAQNYILKGKYTAFPGGQVLTLPGKASDLIFFIDDVSMGHQPDGIDFNKAFRIFLVIAAFNVHGGQILVIQG